MGGVILHLQATSTREVSGKVGGRGGGHDSRHHCQGAEPGGGGTRFDPTTWEPGAGGSLSLMLVGLQSGFR